ncbi:hypothetical protein BAZMOX_121048_0 [methanotrophic endosymbiont of Bathymodiolus azoricus (Menez Gwen)]|nr:hypothetical protein BAZMOX_121048_0 [methanotrophic endosymbiont of Bathymodiolus azoricus (Menez Gwen)]
MISVLSFCGKPFHDILFSGQKAEILQVKIAKTKGNKGGKGIKRKQSIGKWV